MIDRLSIPIVWYIPGAHYSFWQVMRSMPALGIRSSLPYLVQSVYPKKYLRKKILSPTSHHMITVSEFNRRIICKAGWPSHDVKTIPPGKARFTDNNMPPTQFNRWRHSLEGVRYFLFFGPPQAIRGIGQVLSAFSRVARHHSSVRLVCLFRSDAGVDAARWKRRIAQLDCKDRVVCLWESVDPPDLVAFLKQCYAVLKPFLLIPSEIPLAVIEAAGFQKPVLTTGPGGTAEFAEKFGTTTSPGNSRALAQAMLQLLDNEQFYADKCKAAQEVYAAHPTWNEVSKLWISMAMKAVG